ncbi:hypothetical protein PInf_007755 [Phytophthora infestans]|nr:hypothetical protein PInf_007755 [Phytophthora infestans]
MEPVRELRGKNKGKDNDDRSNAGPSSAYRFSDASGEPDPPEYLQTGGSSGGASGHSFGSRSSSTGIGSETSVTGYSGDSGRDKSSYSRFGGDSDDSYHRHVSKEHLRRDGDEDGYYSSYSEDTKHESHGTHGSTSHAGRFSGMDMSDDSQSYGSYASGDSNYD